MPTRNVVITDHHADLLERLVSSGRYQNASEVLREGLRLVEAKESEDKARLRALREAARVGITDMEAGRYTRLDTPDSIRRFVSGISEEVIKEGRKARRERKKSG